MHVRRSDRLRKARDSKHRRSSLFSRSSLLWVDSVSPDRSRSMHVEPLEDRSMLAVLVVDPSNPGDFSSINLAIAAANIGDTIQVVAGTYNEQVNVNKSVTIEGAQAGVDARTRSGPESIVDGNSGTTAFVIGADDVTIDGFTVQDQTNVNVFGAGIWVEPGHHGTHIVNDIVQNNVVGLFLSNNSAADPAVVQHNLFQNNNQIGAAGGTAIYLDQYTGGTVDGVQIDSNKIVGNANAGIGFSSTDPTNHPTSDVSITNNQIDSNGRGIYLYSTSNATIQGNDITNSTVPTDGGSSVGIGLYGDDNNVTISGNNITGGAQYGVRIGGFGTNPNTNVTINGNGIFDNGTNDLKLDDVPPGNTPAYTGILDATKNYWGTTTDTTIASRIADPHNQVAFSPFLNNPDQNPGLLGFQADFSSLTTTTLGAQLPGVGPIEAAILAAAPGATVTVTAGTYIENDIVITQGIQLIANGAVTIQPAAPGIGTGVTINAGAANVTLQGFTLTGFATGISATSANSLLLKDDTLDVSNANGASISGVTSLNVTSTSGAGQSATLAGGAGSSSLNIAGQDAISYSGLTNLTINAGSGSNDLTVDFSGGNPIPAGGLTYNGGSGASSTMLLQGGSFGNEVYTPSGAHAGTIQLDSSAITYSGLAPIQDISNATTITINGTAAGEQLNVVNGPMVGGFQTTEVNSGASGTFELVDFANKTFAVVNGAGGADTVVVNNPTPAAGLNSIALTVNGAGSTVAVNAAGTPVSVNNLAAGSATASVTVGNGTLGGIMGDVTVSGAAGSAALIINDNADGGLRHATVTSSQTSGLASSGAAVKYTAADLSSFTIYGGTNSDTYDVTSTPAGIANAINATAGNTIFNITGSGLGTGSTNAFSATSPSFDNTFNVTGPLNAPASISGSVVPVLGNVLNYDAGGNSVVLTANSITAGAGQTLTFSDIEYVNITDVAGVTVNGDGNANSLTLTHTAGTTNTYTLDGGPLVTFTGASSFAFNGQDGADSLSVDNSGGLINIPISFAGGLGFDSLFVSGNAGTGVSAVYSQTGSDATGFAGSLVYTTGAVTEAINFSGLSPVESLTPVTSLTINDAPVPGPTVENIVTGPTSTGIDPFLGTTATTYQVNYSGAGEPINWRNATNVTVNGSANSDTITENLPNQVDAGSPNQLTTLNINAGGSSDEIDVLATPSGVVTNVDGQGGVPDSTVIGGALANFNNGTGSTAAILGAVNVTDSGGVGQLYVDDSNGAGPDVVTLTNSSIVGAAPVTIGYDATMDAVQIALTAHDDRVYVQSTSAPAVTTLFGNNGSDTFNVSSTAPAVNGNGTLTGDLNGIQGELDIASGAGTDSLNVSDYGGVGRTYMLVSPGAGVTQLSATGIANIVYNSNGGFQLEHFNLVGASAGGNTYNILNTTATLSTVVSDGDASASGKSTFNIQADQLSGASNSFNGFAGDDTFNLNFAAAANIPSSTTLSIDGGGLATGHDRVNVNANLGGASRTVGLDYQSNSTSDVQITGLGAVGNAFSVVGARQVNYYGDAANNDTVSVSGAASGNNTLSVTPLSASSANVFLGGNPLLTIPPGSTGANNPGVAGPGAGPDLYIAGVALAGFSVNGGSTGAGNGNRLVVNGKSEDANGAGGTSAWGGNAFGSPADTVTAGNGYDQIDVSDSKIAIVNNAVGALLAVNYATNSFANPSPTQAAVTVNGGDETTPLSGVADDFTVHLSPAIHFQINGGAPPTGSAPNGDRLNVLTPNDAEIWSDAATPPNVSITSGGALPVSYNSIEELSLTPGNGIVNIYGDNNVSGGAQPDGYRVVGTGPNAFTLQISGNKTDPASYSDPIQINGVTTLNAYGGAKGTDTGTASDALYLTPYADNTPQGWGVQTFWDEGDPIGDGDLLVFNGVSGVSENIAIQPSAGQAGQLTDINAATGTPIAVVNYVLNTNIIVNGSSPAGTAGDTDSLTLHGTDPGSAGASGNEDVLANFAATGDATHPMVRVYDAGSTPAARPSAAETGDTAGSISSILYNLQSFSNFNSINFALGGGADLFDLISGRNNGSLTVNVDGGAPGGIANSDSIVADGTAGIDTFQVSPGASSDAGRISVQRNGDLPTVLNYTATENLEFKGNGGGDNLTLDGTGSNDAFALANGTAQVNSGAPILLTNFGFGGTLKLNGLGGTNSFAVDQATGGLFANVYIDGGPAGNGTAAITGTNADDAINFTPISANSGRIDVSSPATTTYNLTGITSASVDALSQTTGDSLTTATGGTYVNTPGAQPGSGTVQVTLPGNIATLPLSYANVENVFFSGTTLVVNGTSGNDNVSVAADGSVTVNGNPVSTSGFSALVLNLNGGTDNVSIAAGANFSGGILVNGAGQTSVTVTGTSGDDAIGVDAATGQVIGIVSGPIKLAGVQNLTVNGGGAATGDAISVLNLGVPGGLQSINVAGNGAAGDTLQVSGSGGPDNMLVTPSGATSGMLQDSGVGPVVNYSAFSAAGALQVTANALTVNGSAGDDMITVTNGRVAVSGDLPVNYNASATALNIMGLGGSDSLTVDSTTGAVTTPIYYDGGAGSNALTLTGGAASIDIYTPGPATGQGFNFLVIGVKAESVHFVNLAPVIDNVAGPLVVNGTNGDDAITAGASPNRVSVNNLETIAFANKTSLTLNGLAGSDSFAITPSNLSLAGGSITVNGGGLGEGDTLSVTGQAAVSDALAVIPAAAGAGAVADVDIGTLATLSTVNYTGIAGIQLVGQASDGDTAAVTGTSGDDTLTYTPGADATSGSFSGTLNGGAFALPNVSFSQMSPTTGISLFAPLAGLGGNDTVVFNGTNADDTFTANLPSGPFAAFGPTVQLANSSLQQTLSTGTAQNLVLAGGSGNDTYNVPALTNAVPANVAVTVQGNPSANDVLNFTADGTGAVTVDLALQTVTEAGFAPVSFAGVATLNVNAGNNLLTILGTAGPDQFSYTPTDANAGSVTWSGGTPNINVSNVGSFRLDPLGGVDTVTVNATSGHDNTNIVLGSTTTVSVVGLLPVFLPLTNVDSLNVEGNNGDDNFFVFNGGGPNNLQIDGGAGSNLLQLTGNANVADDYSYVPGATGDAGSVNMIVGGNSAKVNFTGIQNLNINAGGGTAGDNVDLDGTGGNDVFTLFGTGPGGAAVQVNNGPHIQISGIGTGAPGSPGILQLRGLEGADTFNITHASNWQLQQLIIIGGASGGSTVNLNGTSGNDNFIYTPTSQNSGEVQVTAGGWTTPDSLDNISNVTINGQQGTNSMLVSTAVVGMSSNSVVTPGPTPGTGVFSVRDLAGNALLPMSYANIQNLTGVGGIAEIVGSGGNDAITVSSAGIVTVTNDLGNSNSIDVHNYNSLVINLEGGQNSVTFLGDNPAMFPGGVKIIGSGSDTVTAPVGAASSLDLAANSVAGVFGGAISTSGVGNLVLNGANGVANAFQVLNYGAASDLSSITLDGGDTDNNDGDTIHVSMAAGGATVNFTSQSASRASLSLASGGPALNIANFNNAAGSLSLTSTVGLKSLNVIGSNAADAITLTNLGPVQRVAQTTGVAWVPLDFSGFGAVAVLGEAGDDTLTVDSSANPFLTPITYDGGAGSNSLTLTGGSATSDTYAPGPAAGQGLSTIVFGAGTQTVHFSNLSPVIDTVVSPLLTVNGTNGDDAINYSDDPINLGNGLVSVNNLETISFLNKTSLAINAGAGSDTINLNNPNTPAGLTSITVDGGDPTSDSDTLIVNGENHNLVLEPTAQGAGTVNYFGGGLPSTPFTNIEHLSFVETLTNPVGIDGTTGNDQFIYAPGVTPDSATITGTMNQGGAAFPLVPVTLTGVNQSGAVVFNAFGQQGGTDQFVYNGVAGNDAISVTAGGTFGGITLSNTVAGQLYSNLNLAHMGGLTVNGGDGNDTVSIGAGAATMPIAVNGNSAQSDVLNFKGDGAAPVTIDLTARTVTETGFGPVSYSGVGTLNVDAGSQPVLVNDTAGPNTLDVTPTGETTATLQVEGQSPVVNLTNVPTGAFSVNFGVGKGDTLVVNGTASPDTINVSGSQVQVQPISSVNPYLTVNYAGAASLIVNGGAGSDTFNVTAASLPLPIHINGGDPIGVLPGDTLNINASGAPVQFFAGPHVDEGGFVVGTNPEISYQQIESIGAISNPGPVVIVGTNGDDDIQVIARDQSYDPTYAGPGVLDGKQDFTVSVNQGPNILFVDATQGLYIDSLSGDDEVDVRAPAPNNNTWNMNIVVTGGPPAGQAALNGDNFTLETPGSGNVVSYQPGAPAVLPANVTSASGTLSLTQPGPANLTTITLGTFTLPAPPLAHQFVSSPGGFESLTYDGQSGGNSLNVLGPAGGAGGDTFTHTPGSAPDGGQVSINSLLPITYQNLGAGGAVNIVDAGSNNTLIANGTAGNDAFHVSTTVGPPQINTVQLNSQAPLTTSGIQNLTLNGLAGDNSYRVDANSLAPLPYGNITVNGSGNSDPDVLNLNGDGSLVTVSMGGTMQTVSGGGLGTVDITGVGVVNLNNGTGEIDVLGAAGPDNFSVTPTGGTTATIQDGALAPVLNTTNSGVLSIQGAAGDGDAVTVHGTGAADTVAVAETALTTTVQVGVWKTISVDSANVAALVVDGGLGADTFNVSGSGGPALTVAGGQTPAADTLNLAAVNATVTYGTDPSSGAIDPGLTPKDVIHFSGLQTINLTGNISNSGSLTVKGTNGDDAIQQLGGQVTVNNGATVAFSGYASLELDGMAGNDHFNVNPATLPVGMTFTVNGGTSTSSDSLTVNGTLSQDQINFLPTAADQGSVTVNTTHTVDFNQIGSVSINGQGGNDQLTVTTPAGGDDITYTAGATIDAASVQVDSLVPMSFTNLGGTGGITLHDANLLPVDRLFYKGTPGNDQFGVTAAPSLAVFLNSQLQVNIPDIASLTMDGQGGLNTFAVDGDIPSALAVNVNGGGAGSGNSLTVRGDNSAPLTVDLGNHTVQEAGFGAISFNGVSQVIVDAAGQNIDVVGGAGDDNLSYTPTATDAGTLQAAGSSTVFNLMRVGNLSLDPLGGTNTVTVNGNSNNNTIDIARGANTTVSVDAPTLLPVSIVSADTQTVIVNSGLGDDTINVSGSGGSALAVNGGSAAANDTLNVTANGFTQVSFGANSTSGTVVTTDPQIAFTGIAVLGLTGDTNSSLSVFATNGNDAINLNENVVTVNGGTNVDFIDYPTLDLFGQSGDDVFNVWPTTTAGLTAINIDGGDPTASDKLIVNGTSGADNINFAPTSADAGSVSIAGSPTVNFTTTESVAINGQGGADALTYTTPSVSDGILTFTPGASANSGGVTGRLANGTALAPLSFSNIDSTGLLKFAHEGVTLPSGAANDTLVVNGTAGDDLFAVTGASIALEKQATPSPVAIALPIEANSISSLTLSGQGGNDTFDLSGTSNYAGVFVQGNGTVDPSVTNLTGDGTAINVNVGGVSTIVTGGGLGSVTITGNQIVNLDAAGGAVTTTDSAGPNTLDVTPTGTQAATLQVEGQAPVVNLKNVLASAFNVTFAFGAGDSLVVNGTTGPDTINASGSQVQVTPNSSVIPYLTVSYAGPAALTVNGSTGADTFNVTPDANVPIHVNGGDPIGVLPGDTLNIVASGSPVSFFSGPHSDEGGFQVGSDAAVSFQQIESIGPIVGPGSVLIVGTNGDDDIQVIARDHNYDPTYAGPGTLDGKQDFTVSVNAGPNLLFIDAPNLYIDSLSGDDEVDVRAPAPNNNTWNMNIVVTGGPPAGQAALNGDNFTLETPGSGNVVSYQPGAPAVLPANVTSASGTLNLTQPGPANLTTITLGTFTLPATPPAQPYVSSPGGFESLTYDGQSGGNSLDVLGPAGGAGGDTFTHTPGSAPDGGQVSINSLLPITYQNLGAGGAVNIVDAGSNNTLIANGTAGNDAFHVSTTVGPPQINTVQLNSQAPLTTSGIQNLTLNGLAGDNSYRVDANSLAPLPYGNITVNGSGNSDPDVLNLNGDGVTAMNVQLGDATQNVSGAGLGSVDIAGVSIVNLNNSAALNVYGTANDDVITYKPTSSAGGTFNLAGVPVNFNFNIGTAVGSVFTVYGGLGNGGNEVDVLGNNAGSVITVDSPNRTVSVENALNTVLKPVVLGPDVQVAGVKGGIGNNTFLVIPARDVPPSVPPTDIVGPGFQMPNNLLVHVDGGAVPANAALVVAADAFGNPFDPSFFAVVNRTSNTSGVVRMFQSTGGSEPIQYPDISYANVGIIQASTAINAATHQQQTLTMGPDTSDPNGSLNNAAYLGSGASINATNLTIFPNFFEHRFLQAEQDWFRVVAQYTGTMDFQVYFKQYAGFLPGGGELQIQVYDAAGNQITAFGVNDTDSDQRRRIPVVAGETYYLQVYGITKNPAFTPADGFDPTNATVNAYSLSITNTPAPKPDSLGLNNIVAQGSINNAIAPTTTTFTASNAAVPPPPTQPLPPLSSIDGFYVGKLLEFTSGSLVGQRQVVTAYVGATHTFTFASGFSAAPAVGDKFQIESNDTGRSQLDNVTRDNTPTIYIRLDAANTPTDGLLDLQGGGSSSQTPPNNTPILIPFWAGNSPTPPNSPANNGSFRVAVYDNTNPQSPLFLGYAIGVPGQQGVFQLQVTTPLSEGTHILAAKVEIDSPSAPSNKDLSAAATTQIVVDTLAPPVYFGSPTVPNSGLLGSSDTGVNGQPATIVDRITADSTPTLYGAAEANAVVRLYSDTNNNGIVDNGDVFLGLTTASPVDGTNQFPSGQWQITTNVDLNNPTLGFPLDGVRHLLVTAEDAAGNVSAPQALTIFLDTQGPTVKNVSVTGSPGFDLFAVKANTVNPTPLVNSLDITFNDQPIRVGPNFVYPAVNPILATTPGNYILIGDATGRVVITSVTFSDSTASGTPGMSVATLHFAAPLPDDRYTLTISDNITDNAGNNLDGEFGPTFSSGNGKIGGQFLGQFTVDSRPELGTYSSGSVSIDLNGNFIFDPQNVDQTNRDTTFTMGFSTDRLFAGKLADSHGVVNGFDKLGAYGFLNGQWRWLLDLDGDGVIDPAKGDLSVVEPLALDALPVAGNWTNSPTHADQIGLFDGKTWWLDMNGDHVIDATDIALGGELTGNMKGLPIVGDFDGDGKTDLGTFANGMFYFDLSSKDPGGKLTGNTNTTLNVQTDLPNNIGFAGVLARPVAADMNHDGITDIGLFVPGRTQNASPSTAEWYWLISNDPNGTNRITGTVNTLNHPFDPTPLGHDLYAQFGNQFALPLVGNFDPPANGGSGGGTQSGGGNWIQNLYLDVLGRAASTDEVAYWTDQVNHGVTGAQIATLFLTSTEHRSQLINTLYQQYLGRQADQAGINYWIGIWNATGGPEAVQAGIIGSAEYYATAGGTDAAWVTALYQNILGRTVDAQGLAYWTDYIKTHTKQSVVMGFVTSDEYRLGLINGWFQVYLGRTLDASGAQFWLNQMKLGETQEQIQAGILGSTEFRNR